MEQDELCALVKAVKFAEPHADKERVIARYSSQSEFRLLTACIFTDRAAIQVCEEITAQLAKHGRAPVPHAAIKKVRGSPAAVSKVRLAGRQERLHTWACSRNRAQRDEGMLNYPLTVRRRHGQLWGSMRRRRQRSSFSPLCAHPKTMSQSQECREPLVQALAAAPCLPTRHVSQLMCVNLPGQVQLRRGERSSSRCRWCPRGGRRAVGACGARRWGSSQHNLALSGGHLALERQRRREPCSGRDRAVQDPNCGAARPSHAVLQHDTQQADDDPRRHSGLRAHPRANLRCGAHRRARYGRRAQGVLFWPTSSRKVSIRPMTRQAAPSRAGGKLLPHQLGNSVQTDHAPQ